MFWWRRDGEEDERGEDMRVVPRGRVHCIFIGGCDEQNMLGFFLWVLFPWQWPWLGVVCQQADGMDVASSSLRFHGHRGRVLDMPFVE